MLKVGGAINQRCATVANETSVSVILPVYNAEAYLRRAVLSVEQQDWAGDLQIVIVDDCSTDGTGVVVAELAAADPRIVVLSCAENQGPAAARNLGIDHATGDWLAVLDADDAYAPARLSRLVATAQEEQLDAIADLLVLYDLAADCRAPESDQYPASGEVQQLKLEDFLKNDPETGLDLGLLKPVFHRSLEETGLLHYPSHLRHGEDCALYIALVQAGKRFGLLREAHYLFSTRIGVVSQKLSPGSVTDVDYRSVAAEADRLRSVLRDRGDLDQNIDALLAARVATALKQNRRYGWSMLRRKEWRRLARWFRKNPKNIGTLLSVIGSKAAGHRGLPD